MDRMIAVEGGASLQCEILALEPNAASEELNDFGALPATNIQEAHVGDTPRIPSLHELLCADKDVNACARFVDSRK